MTTTISATNGAGNTSPLAILAPYSTAWQSRNIVHDTIGGDIAVSLVPPRPRSGTLELLYAAEDDAYACSALHGVQTSFTLSEPEVPHMAMTYVVDREVSTRLNEQTGEWVVSVGFQEVAP